MTRISKVILKEPIEVLVIRQPVCEGGVWIHAVFHRNRGDFYQQTWYRFR